MTRVLLPGLVANLRDLGGLPAGERVVAPGVLWRAGSLVHLPASALDALTALAGPGRYLDLRTDEEVDRDGGAEPLVARGWRWCRVPLADRVAETGVAGPTDPAGRLRALLPRYSAAADAVAARLLTREVSGPDVLACSLGKDRTGVVTALLLHRAGADPAAIAADYALSTASLAAGRHLLPARWRDPGRALGEVTEAECAAVLRAHEDAGGAVCARLRAHLTGTRDG